MTMSVMGTLVVVLVPATPASMDRDDTSNNVLALTITFLGVVAASMALKSRRDMTYVHIVDLFLRKLRVKYRLVNLHSSERHEGIHSHCDLFLARLIIIWHVG